MDKGIIDESLLTKDIELIDMYAKEENSTLLKICSICDEASQTYVSSNSSIINSYLNYMPNDADRLYKKREAYSDVLRRVIKRYNTLAYATREKFEDIDLWFGIETMKKEDVIDRL